jgi:hypothetical protein
MAGNGLSLESALVELADPSIILALIGGYAADRRSYDGGLSRAVRKVALGQRPVEGWVAGACDLSTLKGL